MSKIPEFRVVFMPIPNTTEWSIMLMNCSLDECKGGKGTFDKHYFTTDQLSLFKSANGWENNDQLHSLGASVWNSIFTQDLLNAFKNCLQNANNASRLVFSVIGNGSQPLTENELLPNELPVEALYEPSFSFLGLNMNTPISRGIKYSFDKQPTSVTLPLRILVIAATPYLLPAAGISQDVAEIQKVIDAIDPTHSFYSVDYCSPGTRENVKKYLKNNYQILHFLGHGAFDIVGTDPTPRPYICFVDDKGNSDPMDADTFEMLLENTGIRLALITACSTATLRPGVPNETYHLNAFNGIAQRLLSQTSEIAAVVAMQFDIEDRAALAFTRAFYQEFIDHSKGIDEVITACRRAIAGTMNVGHRAWVNPVLYSRCPHGRVFLLGAPVLDQLTTDRVKGTDELIDTYRDAAAELQITDLHLAPVRNLLFNLRSKINKILDSQVTMLGNSARFLCAPLTPDSTAACSVTFTLTSPAMVGDIILKLKLPEQMQCLNTHIGRDIQTGLPFIADGGAHLLLRNASNGKQWLPGTYEILTLTLKVTNPTAISYEIQFEQVEVTLDDQVNQLPGLRGFLFAG